MRKKLLALVLALVALVATGTTIVLGDPTALPPIEFTPTSAPIDPYEPYELD